MRALLVPEVRAAQLTPDVDGHEEGLCVKRVEGVLTV
jgi:hypothetical protein